MIKLYNCQYFWMLKIHSWDDLWQAWCFWGNIIFVNFQFIPFGCFFGLFFINSQEVTRTVVTKWQDNHLNKAKDNWQTQKKGLEMKSELWSKYSNVSYVIPIYMAHSIWKSCYALYDMVHKVVLRHKLTYLLRPLSSGNIAVSNSSDQQMSIPITSLKYQFETLMSGLI